VHIVAFTADGRRLITASNDRTARLWDAEPVVLRANGSVLRSVFNTEGVRILTVSADNMVQLWDVGSGTVLREFKGHKEKVRTAAFGPGNRLVVTASVDNSARLWDISTGESKLIISGHEEIEMPNPGQIALALAEQDPDYKPQGYDKRGVTSAAFSPDGLRVVTSSFDRTARVWDANTGAPLAVLSGHEATVYSAAFSPDGSRVATASEDGTARLWNALTGQVITVLKGHLGRVMDATFSPDGSRVATASYDGTARVWDANTGVQLVLLRHITSVDGAAFSPNGRRLVTASDDGAVRLWEIETETVVGFLRGHTEAVSRVDFSPDGSHIVTASGNTARLWRAFQDTHGLVAHIKRSVPRCLTRTEREKAFLAREPPRWCITGPGLEQEADAAKWTPKWPYDTSEWRDWLVAADAARRKGLVAPPAPK